MREKISQIVFLVMVFGFFIGCERRMDSKNKFINDFLIENGKQLYKSEMKRTKLDYLPSSQQLVYSFWKKEVFEDNGELFLHLYPEDSLALPESRYKYGFLNIGIGEEDIQNIDSVYFYIVKDLSVYGKITRMVTGQYIGNKRTWQVDEIINLNSSNNGLKLNGIESPKLENSSSGFIKRLLSENSFIQHVDSETKVNCFISPNKDILYLSNLNPSFLKGNFEFRFYRFDRAVENIVDRKSVSKIKTYCPEKTPCFASLTLPKSIDTISFVSLENNESKALFSIGLEQ